jgi:hypothetical protein
VNHKKGVIAMKAIDTDLVTKNLLQICYTCDDAMECETEETCRQCWADKGIAVDEESERSETAILLQAYYE